MYKSYIKRFLDILLSLFGVVFLSPFFILISILIKIDSKGKVLFKQKRIGKFKKIFVIYKFRTMIENAYENGGLLTSESDPRITKFGAFLRKTSIDEIPQLLNILKGEMSIIGPRPILEEEFKSYDGSTNYDERFNVRPGLFCTVDVEFRALATRDLQFDMDVQYSRNISPKLDLKVFISVFKSVIFQRNIYKS